MLPVTGEDVSEAAPEDTAQANLLMFDQLLLATGLQPSEPVYYFLPFIPGALSSLFIDCCLLIFYFTPVSGEIGLISLIKFFRRQLLSVGLHRCDSLYSLLCELDLCACCLARGGGKPWLTLGGRAGGCWQESHSPEATSPESTLNLNKKRSNSHRYRRRQYLSSKMTRMGLCVFL